MSARPNPALTQTNWDLIRDAASGSDSSRRSLDEVARRVWPAVFAFIRASGRPADEAADLTQGFLADVFLSRRLLEKADASRGRFRTLLLGSVRNYLADAHRRRTARSRRPEQGVVTLDSEPAQKRPPVDHGTASPERVFHTRYVATLIRGASERLQQELLAKGDEASWEIFRLRVLQAAFAGDAPGYDEIAPRFGLDKGTCAARLLTTKRRFAAILMEALRATVDDPAELKSEIDELRTLLAGR
ncbi:MAG: hypothetical protein RIS86_1241 [Planctomycetota bacterium]|jgi:RNA polymerase sigma factor (sigma-70 family)